MRITHEYLKTNANGKTWSEAAQYWRSLAEGFQPGSRQHEYRLRMAAAYEELAADSDQGRAAQIIEKPGAGKLPSPAGDRRDIVADAAGMSGSAIDDLRSDSGPSSEPSAPEGPAPAPKANLYQLAARRAVEVRQGKSRVAPRPDRARVAPRPVITVTRGGGGGFAGAAWVAAGWKVVGRIEDHRGPGALVQAPASGTYYKLFGNRLSALDQRRVREALLNGKA
ncbi:MAG: hypothetical protein ACOZDY_08890 [Pseudomonadota bacterium]